MLCVMYSPLMGLFDDAANTSWVKPTGSMVQADGSGNGFGWGQLSHLLGWVLFVGGLNVEEVVTLTLPLIQTLTQTLTLTLTLTYWWEGSGSRR